MKLYEVYEVFIIGICTQLGIATMLNIQFYADPYKNVNQNWRMRART